MDKDKMERREQYISARVAERFRLLTIRAVLSGKLPEVPEKGLTVTDYRRGLEVTRQRLAALRPEFSTDPDIEKDIQVRLADILAAIVELA